MPDHDSMYSLEDAQENPRIMASDRFSLIFAEEYQMYARLKLSGMLPSIAFRRVFPDYLSVDNHATARIYALESSDLFNEYYKNILMNTPIRELWNERLAVHRLLTIAQNPFEKGSTQVNAVKELNVLVGITIIDEGGKSRRGASMEDFYRSLSSDEENPEAPPASH